MDKEDAIHTHTHTHTHRGILLSHKKHEILPFVTTRRYLGCMMLKEIKQTEKDKYCRSHLYVKSQKQNKGTNKNENRFINTKNKRGC